MPPSKTVTLGAFLAAQLKTSEQAAPESVSIANSQPRQQRCRCEGPFDLCWRYPAAPNAVCKATWDRLLAPFQFKGREWTIVELRSLWPHTVQALTERLVKGRTERTLKEDLQDDLQVLIDLIQHSCKPHPRPPRAGMKTLIVQGRILAEAIAQDALFQLDPSAPSAPRPDRELVDLINRLREQHPTSLLAPALHVLRTLGNTAVHLDRDSARLTDAEIGDAAAVCCRFVVLVIDAYMQMCANLHRHEETEEALAQPLQELPAAPIPAPNVLLRPREPAAATAASSAVGEEPAAATTAAVAAAPSRQPPQPQLLPQPHLLHCTVTAAPSMQALQPQTQIQQQHQTQSCSFAHPHFQASWQPQQPEQPQHSQPYLPPGAGAHARPPPSSSSTPNAPPPAPNTHAPPQPERVGGSAGGQTGGTAGGGGDGDDLSGAGAARAWRDSGSSGSGGSRRSCSGSADGAGRVPYSLVTAAAHPPMQTSGGGGGGAGSGGGSGGGSPRGQGSRGWWPLAPEPHAVAPPALLCRTTFPETNGTRETDAADAMAARANAPPLSPHSTSTSVSNWLHGHPMPYGLPVSSWLGNGVTTTAATAASAHFSRLSNGSTGSGGGGAADAAMAVATMTAVYGRQPGASLAGAAHRQHATAEHNPHRGSDHPAGGSPRRSPISLITPGIPDPTVDPAAAAAASAGVSVRGSSPKHLHPSHPPHPHAGGPSSTPQRPAVPGAVGLGITPGSGSNDGGGGGAGSGGGGGVLGPGSGGPPVVVGTVEASKRLLQLCATAQTPSAAKVHQLLQAGASLGVSDKSGMTALHMACYWCHAEAAALLLERLPQSVAAAADREGRTPLWVAAQRGHVELVQLLLMRGLGGGGAAAVDVPNAAGVTPLRVAAAQGHTLVVEALLQAGAGVELADKDGFTPLYVACARSHLEVVRLLLAAGASVDRADKGQRTPLWAALHPGGSAKGETCPERRAAAVRALLAAGADVHLLPDGRDRDYCWQVLAQSLVAGE